jgi:general secretion pathway protein A
VYPNYFGLKEASFSITPDPQYLFLSEQHREALAHLLYGAGESGGFVLLTGEVGTGKTTVCRAFLEQLPEGVDVALVLNPAMTAVELLHAICDEFRLDVPAEEQSAKALVDRLNVFLLQAHANGRRPVLIIDEAQNLRPKVMEQIRLLTNLETTKHKLLQIFLIGQPELREIVASPELRQLNQRITARFHLKPLSARETAAYVDHRVIVAGVDRPLFTPAALRRVHRHSGGVPRLINLLCDRSLLGAAVSRKLQVTPAIVTNAAREVRGSADPALPRRGRGLAIAASVLLALAGGVWIGASGLVDDLPRELTQLFAPDQVPAGDSVRDSADEAVEDQSLAAAPAGAPADSSVESQGESLGELGADAFPAPAATEPSAALALAEPTPDAATAQAPKPAAAEAALSAAAETPMGASGVPERDKVAESAPSDLVTPGLAQSGPVESTPADSTPPSSTPAAAAEGQQESMPRISMARVKPTLSEVDAAQLPKLLVPEAGTVDELLRFWGVATDTVVSGLTCPAVAAFGLDCERGSGRWSDLRLFDRPAALQLALSDGGEGYAVISGIDDEHVMLHHGGTARRVPIALLDERWSGDYLMLWRPPPFGVKVIGRGSSSDAVGWLRERLASLPGAEIKAKPARYDAELTTAVKRFQADRGLSVDGVAGPRTLILLSNAVMAVDVPYLTQSHD